MTEEITIGSKVKVLLDNETRYFEVVGSADVDVNNGKISYLSPFGEALLGRKASEQFEIELPNGKRVKVEIMEIK